MNRIVVLIALFLCTINSFSQSSSYQNQRLNQKNILLSQDSLYIPLFKFFLEKGIVSIIDSTQIRISNLDTCSFKNYGIYKFEKLASGQDIFLCLIDRNGSVKVFEDYEFEHLTVEILKFFKENNYTDNSKCLIFRNLMDFLLEKYSFNYDVDLKLK